MAEGAEMKEGRGAVSASEECSFFPSVESAELLCRRYRQESGID